MACKGTGPVDALKGQSSSSSTKVSRVQGFIQRGLPGIPPRLHQKQSQRISIQNISGGGLPPDPPSRHAWGGFRMLLSSCYHPVFSPPTQNPVWNPGVQVHSLSEGPTRGLGVHLTCRSMHFRSSALWQIADFTMAICIERGGPV